MSTVKLPRSIENSALILIAFFLCFGYMTGTDWYNYEQYYNNTNLAEKFTRSQEFGYFFIETFIGKLGVDFWAFHIVVKLLVFYSLIRFVRWFNANVFLYLALFIPEIGFYLFIDCPFRNLIAFGIALIAFRKLLENKTLSYFVYVLIAMSFHLSAAIMILFYFVYKKNIKIYIILFATLIIYLVAFNVEFLISNIYIPLAKISPLISERLQSYFVNSRYISDKISIGAFIRLFVLLILLFFKEVIISGEKKRQYVYNLSILFLLIHPFGVTMKIFDRLFLFLIPFYIISIIYLLKSLTIKSNKYILYLFFILFSLKLTYSIISYDYRYVPYTNYMFYWVKNDFPKIEYRKNYNPKHSPYKELKPQK
jgi:hypothetical protein